MVLCFVAFAFGLCVVWRVAFCSVLASEVFHRRFLIVGGGWGADIVVEALAKFDSAHYRLVGAVHAGGTDASPRDGRFPVLGDLDQLANLVQKHGVSDVVLAGGEELSGASFGTLAELLAQRVNIVRAPTLYENLTGRVYLQHLDASWMVSSFMERVQSNWWVNLCKRGMDLVVGLMGMIVTVCIAPFIALGLWLEDGGTVFFRQVRLGRDGRRFTILKFRSMKPNAEADSGARWTSEQDDRITRFGSFLRRTRLDELPQFWNVLKGEMSLVGPRPERPEFVELLEKEIPFYRVRLRAKQGITGWAQVKFRYGESTADAVEKLEYDIYYIKHQSLFLDWTILAQTLGVMLGFRGR